SIPLQKVFMSIESQTGYVVMCRKELLDKSKPVTVSASRIALPAFLDVVLKGQDLEYTIKSKTILISGKAAGSAPPARPEIQVPPINGTIKDASGTPLTNATVIIKGTSRAISSGEGGRFSINVKPGDVLVISH